jgi:hypothetical protein
MLREIGASKMETAFVTALVIAGWTFIGLVGPLVWACTNNVSVVPISKIDFAQAKWPT